MTARCRPASTLLLATLTLTGTIAGGSCAGTTFEDGAADPSATVAAPETTATTAGTAAELLPQLAEEASGLSRVMIDGGDDRASAERIAALWQAVREEVAASRPELVADFDANVRRCAAAVEFNRAADADKAAANLLALVDAYLG